MQISFIGINHFYDNFLLLRNNRDYKHKLT